MVDEEEVMQYGIEFSTMKIELKIRAFPPPKVFWYFNEEKIEYGERYSAYIKPTGIVTLEIPDLSWNDTGDYKCYIENELGFASQIVTLNLAGQLQFFLVSMLAELASVWRSVYYRIVHWLKIWCLL